MNSTKWRLGFLASHRGSNLQAVIDAVSSGELNAIPAIVISNNPDSFALERAKLAHIPTAVINAKTHGGPSQADIAICDLLLSEKVDLVILVGYMKQLGKKTLLAFSNRIINIHPALLPKHGGKGMYGIHVHESVIRSGDRESGATVHIVTDNYDEGKILAQRTVLVHSDDNAQSLAERVIVEEHQLLVNTIREIINGATKLT